MDSALRPRSRGVIHEVGDIGVSRLIHHVMMLVDMQDMRRTRQGAPSYPVLPASKCLVMFLYDEGDGGAAPLQQLLKPLHRVIYKAKVVQVNVQDGTHVLSITSCQHVGGWSTFLVILTNFADDSTD
jgi:hypothetical protein